MINPLFQLEGGQGQKRGTGSEKFELELWEPKIGGSPCMKLRLWACTATRHAPWVCGGCGGRTKADTWESSWIERVKGQPPRLRWQSSSWLSTVCEPVRLRTWRRCLLKYSRNVQFPIPKKMECKVNIWCVFVDMVFSGTWLSDMYSDMTNCWHKTCVCCISARKSGIFRYYSTFFGTLLTKVFVVPNSCCSFPFSFFCYKLNPRNSLPSKSMSRMMVLLQYSWVHICALHFRWLRSRRTPPLFGRSTRVR